MNSYAYGSPVVGYVRSPQLNDAELDDLEAEIRQYAREHGYNLVKVFREEGISSVAAWRPELESLIRGLERRDWVGVVTLHTNQLSGQAFVAKRIQSRIEDTGWIEYMTLILSRRVCIKGHTLRAQKARPT
jgi:hypothetical protein